MAIGRRLLATGAVAAAVSLALPALPAAAAPPDRGHVLVEIIDVDETTTLQNFCGIEGLTVTQHDVFSGREAFTFRGPDAIPYFTGTVHGVTTFTEPDGTTVTIRSSGVNKDQRIVDNGDGTWTITAMGAGGFRVVGPNATLRDPGMLQFGVVIDPNGTPQDPDDDDVVAELGVVRESTGLNELGESLCADYPLLTGE
jgi:hypothetical protein